MSQNKIFLYNDGLSTEQIDYIVENTNEREFHDGQIGNRINMEKKRRKDFFVKEPKLLRYIDNAIFDNMYHNITANFGEIKYRETWKIGKYYGDNEGFYSPHTDTAGDTNYRTMSMICSMSDPEDYEGGELCFDDLNICYKFKKGQIVLFDSSLMHHVNPVTKGLRVVIIGFMFNDVGLQVKRSSGRTPFNVMNYMPLLDKVKISYEDKNLYNAENKAELEKKLGDIDYSDKHKINPWRMTDDYYMEDNDSDVLLVTFAGMGWKDSIPTFIFHNFLKEYANIDKLFLRDINCRYYIHGLKNSTQCLEETIELYKNLISGKKQYRKIIALGCSAGGFAAILFGQILGFDKVIAFSPQTVLTDLKESLIGDTYNAPKTCQWLRNLYPDNEMYQNALDLNNYRPFMCPIDIHYSVSGNNGADKKHALYLKSKYCNIIEHPGKDHMIALTLRNQGKLKEIIENEIYDDINIILDDNLPETYEDLD